MVCGKKESNGERRTVSVDKTDWYNCIFFECRFLRRFMKILRGKRCPANNAFAWSWRFLFSIRSRADIFFGKIHILRKKRRWKYLPKNKQRDRYYVWFSYGNISKNGREMRSVRWVDSKDQINKRVLSFRWFSLYKRLCILPTNEAFW